MKLFRFAPRLLLAVFALCLLGVSASAHAHGSVTPEEDLCLIRIGYYSAHFKIYLPQQRGHDQFCEDLPTAGESVFVMEYEHSGLSEVPIDFRIIRNITGQGRFTQLKHVNAVDDLDAHTVYYLPAATQPDVFTAMYDFGEAGEFVGIVTVNEPATGEVLTAVFPFDVGFTGFGYWPLLVIVGLLLQLNYLWMSGWFGARSWRGLIPKKLFPVIAAVTLLPMLLTTIPSTTEAEEAASANATFEATWQSREGRFNVRVEPALQPVVINQMHSWIVEVQTDQGEPVANAVITANGGMPAHDHGLPTQPQVTQNLGDGRYLLEGLRFHMHGVWQLTLHIDDGKTRDDVIIEFML